MASTVFTNFCRNLGLARHNFGSDTLKTLLVSSVPSETNLDGWIARSDVTNEISGTGYTTGGVAQAFTYPAVDTANNRQPLTLTDLSPGWTGATFSAVGAIPYKNSGVAANDYLIEFVDFGGTFTCTAGTFTVDYTSDLLINRV